MTCQEFLLGNFTVFSTDQGHVIMHDHSGWCMIIQDGDNANHLAAGFLPLPAFLGTAGPYGHQSESSHS